MQVPDRDFIDDPARPRELRVNAENSYDQHPVVRQNYGMQVGHDMACSRIYPILFSDIMHSPLFFYLILFLCLYCPVPGKVHMAPVGREKARPGNVLGSAYRGHNPLFIG